MSISIGENIKIMRHKCGFTQEQLAAQLSVTPQAVSKWENGGGLPDLSLIVPLAQIFGITTDSLLGAASAVYGKAHTEATLGHEKLIMSSSMQPAEKHLAIYSYFRIESEKEPTNYTIMCKCINHAAEISRYADFDGFMADSTEERDEIFQDCERKNACITRFCDDRTTVERSDFAMAWIYIHTKQFDKAREMIERLPSLESNNLRESIMTKLIKFQYGFEQAKDNISANIRKLLYATTKEFFYSFEDLSWHAESEEALSFCEKILKIVQSYKSFDYLEADVAVCENYIRRFLPRCYAAKEDYEKAAEELYTIAKNCITAYSCNDISKIKSKAYAELENALSQMTEEQREQVKKCKCYKETIDLIEKTGDKI